MASAELGQLLSGSGQNDRTRESVRLLRKAVGYDPDDGWSRAYLANGLWTLRRLKAAEEQYRKLNNYHLGKHLLYWGRTVEAKRYLRKAAHLGHSKAEERLREIER